jgi:hypothetical protein
MPIINRLADRIASTKYGRNAMNEPVDLGYFRQKPSLRLITGLLLLVLSYIICWPVIAILTFLAAYYRNALIIVIGGPLVYGLSWAVFGLSMLLLGIHSYYGAEVIGHYFTRQFLEKYSSKIPDKELHKD